MSDFYNTVQEVLKQDSRFFSVDGVLLRNIVYQSAMQMDKQLIQLLLSNSVTKERFFSDIDGVLVFDKVGFGWVINNRQFLPDSYTRFKNKIGLVDDKGRYISDSEDTVLVWPYKDCVLEGGQTKEDQDRDEIFYNETLAPDEVDRLLYPKVLTQAKRYSSEGIESIIEFNEDDNLIVKGNNLLALASLLKRYEGLVKCIFIDPPYNTGADSFRYNDSFNHSTWLTFMKNRLQMAKKFLKEDGFICCQVNESESAYLKVLMDEIFKPDNYLATLFIKVRYAEKSLKRDMDFHKEIEQIHIYRKSPLARPVFDEVETNYEKFCYYVREKRAGKEIKLGGKKVEVFKPEEYEIVEGEGSPEGLKEIWASGTILDGNSSGRFFRDYLEGRTNEDGLGILYKVYGIGDDQYDYRYFTGPKRTNATKGKYYQGVPVGQLDNTEKGEIPIYSFYDMAANFGNCRHEGGVELRGGKKPELLLYTILKHFSSEDELVMDFFLGSGTTAAVALKMNRKYIGIEQLDYSDNDSVIRLNNVIAGEQTGISKTVNWQGGGSFVFCELKKLNQRYVDLIQDSSTDDELMQIWQEIKDTGFISSLVNPSSIEENASEFNELSLKDKQRLLLELLDKNMLYVNLCDIDDEEFNISEEDKSFNKSFYGR